LVYFLK